MEAAPDELQQQQQQQAPPMPISEKFRLAYVSRAARLAAAAERQAARQRRQEARLQRCFATVSELRIAEWECEL